MEALVAFGVIESAPLLAAWTALVHFTSASAIGVRLVAVGSIVTEACVVGAVLPADGANSRVAILAVIEAKSSILLLAGGAIGQGLASSATSGFFPA